MLVGGATAVERDVRVSAARDTRVIVPLILLVVFLILLVLLRAVLGPGDPDRDGDPVVRRRDGRREPSSST